MNGRPRAEKKPLRPWRSKLYHPVPDEAYKDDGTGPGRKPDPGDDGTATPVGPYYQRIAAEVGEHGREVG